MIHEKEKHVVSTELATIEQEHGGRLTPDAVVRAAKPKTSALHGYFVWDDKVAGPLYRIDQARELIRSVRCTFEYADVILRVPNYVKDPSGERSEQGYVSVKSIIGKSERARQVVESELARVTAAVSRLRGVANVLDLRTEVEALLAAVVAMELKTKDRS